MPRVPTDAGTLYSSAPFAGLLATGAQALPISYIAPAFGGKKLSRNSSPEAGGMHMFRRRQEAYEVRQPGARTRARRRIGAAVIAGLTAWLCLALAPAAQAALGLQGLSAQPSNLAAGAHSD